MSFWEQQFDKRKNNNNITLVFELSVSYLLTSIRSAPGPHHPHTACDYQHLSESFKTQVSQISVTAENSLDNCKELSPLGLIVVVVEVGSAWQTEIQKGISFNIKAPLIKKSKKMSSPVMTASKQLIY